MKRTIPILLLAALALCSCKDENEVTYESSTVSDSTVTESVVSTTSSAVITTVSTAGTTVTKVKSTEITTSISHENKDLMEDGIIPPEVEEVRTEDEIPQVTLPASEDDKPIELPVIPIG